MTPATDPQRKARIERAIRWGALAVGVALFCGTLYFIDFHLAAGTIRRLGFALPLALVCSGLWHLVRTWAWAWCFPQPRTVSFARLARVRLAAEAFSYLTLRGIAGEPLKVVLLGGSVDAREATAAVALERIAYMIGTAIIVGIGSILAMAGLPLTHAWFRVFRAFAIMSGVVALFTVLVIRGRGTYVHSWLARIDRLAGTSMSAGRASRFISAVERQMLQLVRGNPVRLIVLLASTIAAYVCMSLEAWVILRASGTTISVNGALAVETFSRVTSFATAFIPANLGALEATSLAAVAAVGAASGGAALALARRLRGLFWAGLGLAIYPRRGSRNTIVRLPAFALGASAGSRRSSASDSRSGGGKPDATDGLDAGPRRSPPVPPATLLYLPFDDDVTVPPSARLAGLSIAERALRAARRAGYTRIVIWAAHRTDGVSGSGTRAPGSDAWLRRLVRSVGGSISIATTEHQWRDALAPLAPGDPVTVIGAGTVVSTSLLEDARSTPAAGTGPRHVPASPDHRVSGVLRMTAAGAGAPAAVRAWLAATRGRAERLPSGEDVSQHRARLALRIVTPADLAAAEQTIRRASYKETDARLARFNRRMSLPISIALIRTPLTANQLSVILVALGFYSAWLFGTGHYLAGVIGAFLSLAASVLDGCDGEIARLKYQESALGCWIETVGDYSYYLAIFVGLTIGAVRRTAWEGFSWLGGTALAGTLLTFALLIYLRTRITAGRPEQLHAIARTRFKAEPTFWSRIVWRISFVATRAAMPYGIMAFALADALPAIVILAAVGANVYWISLALRLRLLLGAERGVESLIPNP